MKDGADLKEDSRVVVNRDFAPHGSYEITIHKVSIEIGKNDDCLN